MKNLILFAALSFAPLLAQAADVSTEQSIVLASNKRMQEIALARVPIETRYLAALKQAYSKAESAKDLELQIKIKKEIEIVEANIEYFKNKSVDDGQMKIFGIKWVSQGYWFKMSGPRGKYTNSEGLDKKFEIKDNVIYVDNKSIGIINVDDGSIKATTGNQIVFYPEGKVAKPAPKAPEGEEVNTLFGRRVK